MRWLLLVLALLVGVLCGCGKHMMPYTYNPPASNPPVIAPAHTISISVNDNRPYVISGEKPANFAGIVRAGFGIPKDVITERGVIFARMFKSDLETDLRNAGYTVLKTGGHRQIEVDVMEHNFDCYTSCRVWHELHVKIKDQSGAVLHEKVISESQEVDRIPPYNGYAALRGYMPIIYTQMVQSAIRHDPEAMAALQK